MSSRANIESNTGVQDGASDDDNTVLSSATSDTTASASAQSASDSSLPSTASHTDSTLHQKALAIDRKVKETGNTIKECLSELFELCPEDDFFEALHDAERAEQERQGAIADMHKAHEAIFLAMQQQHQTALDKLKQEHQRTLEDLKRGCRASIGGANHEHESSTSAQGKGTEDGNIIASPSASETATAPAAPSPSVTPELGNATSLKDLAAAHVLSIGSEKFKENFEDSINELKAAMKLHVCVRQSRAALEEAQQKHQSNIEAMQQAHRAMTTEIRQHFQDTIATMQREHEKTLDDVRREHQTALEQQQQEQAASDTANKASLEDLQSKQTELLEVTRLLWRELFETVGQCPSEETSGPEKLNILFLSAVHKVPRFDCAAVGLAEGMAILRRLFVQNPSMFDMSSPEGRRRRMQALRLRGGERVNKKLNQDLETDERPGTWKWYDFEAAIVRSLGEMRKNTD